MDFGFLNLPYHLDHWPALLRYLFGEAFRENAVPLSVQAEHERVRSFVQNGVIQLNDVTRTRINVYAVELHPGLTKVHRNRVMLATIIDKIRADSAVAGALAVFADAESGKWRLTLAAKRDSYTADGEALHLHTEARRFTYLLGKDENTRTARLRFQQLAGIANKRLEDVLEAFSVESINREFFDRYKILYEKCWHYLAKPDSKAYEIFKINPKVADDAAKKPMRDFAKRLMGRLVFLYFLQKKGWMGCPTDRQEWIGGDPDFVGNLFRNVPPEDKSAFYSEHLTRLFFRTLNERREGDLFSIPNGAKVRIPYLNGGLFDGDVKGTEKLNLPAEWFVEMFEFFGQYNFTVDESAPNDHEIGIDPEMLGHIFENLLEENREKGAYYTPKEIVHYMCQESLLLYLKERLGLVKTDEKTPSNTITVNWSDSRADDERELEQFVRLKQRGAKGGFIYSNARLMEKLLKDVRICDPAIGSGAFPMGLLYEIFFCQVELDLTEDYAALKKDIIHRCIYGVDKDKGAVDIARLRFWLALVVDEETPQPLPNLDYKIMQGDSLLESFEGIDLSNLLGKNGNGKKNGGYNNPPELFSVVEEPAMEFGEKDKARLARWINEFFAPQSSEEKAGLQAKINHLINRELDEAIRRYKMSLLVELGNQKNNLDRELELKRPGVKTQKEISRLEAEIAACETKQEKLDWWQQREEKPYFLWHTWFREVFDAGGFDIVIGNPPYVRQEIIGATMKAVLKELYPVTSNGTADLLVYFVELAYSKLLRPGGQFAFIINNKWIRSGYGEGLRQLLQSQTRVHQLLDFGDLPVFESALAYPCILLFEKNPPAGTFDVVLFEDVPFRNGKKLPDEVTRLKFPVKTDALRPEQWHLNPPFVEGLLNKVNESSVSLDEYIGGGAYYGIKTGASAIFMLPQEEFERIPQQERDILKPMLMGRDLKKYFSPSVDKFLIRLEKGITNKMKGLKHPEEWLSAAYPNIFQYLKVHEENAAKRYDKGDYWWELRACDYYDLFERPKIMYQGFQVSPCFIFDMNGLYCNNSVWFIPRYDKYLLGYLNSQLGWWCITMYCSRIQNGYQLMYDYFKNIPVPQADGRIRELVADFVDMIMLVKQQEWSARHQMMSDYFERIVDVLIYEASFGPALKEREVDIVGRIEYDAAPQHIEEVAALFDTLYNPSHPIQTALFNLRLVPEVAYIQNSNRKNSN